LQTKRRLPGRNTTVPSHPGVPSVNRQCFHTHRFGPEHRLRIQFFPAAASLRRSESEHAPAPHVRPIRSSAELQKYFSSKPPRLHLPPLPSTPSAISHQNHPAPASR
jgi:hypothetical protein